MSDNKIIKADYKETMLKILIVEVNWLLAYWNISKEYNDVFLKKYGSDFFEKTREVLKIKNLSNNTEETIEIKEKTNNYYVKFNYSDSVYQVELTRVGLDSDEEYGYKLVSNCIHSPNVKILLNDGDDMELSYRDYRTNGEIIKKSIPNEKIAKLYEETMKPAWNAYKIENGYKEK